MMQCYNRGCGLKYDPNENDEESCRHHPGAPFFHDAYKGWSCCNRKSVDFTEFLNMKGCSLSKHSNEKPPEPEKSAAMLELEELPVVRKPIVSASQRPSFDGPLIKIQPTVLPALKVAIDSLEPKARPTEVEECEEISVGTICKNSGCNRSYVSPESEETECQHHPGVPIFHEGLKFWSCCTKRTSDFTAFMNQVGCSFGKHKWKEDDVDQNFVSCRYDWHQTPSDVIVAIYAKLYHYAKSSVEINPVRLKVCLIFPDQHDATFQLDVELRGIIKVESTSVKMFSTKVEITMPKAEPGSWANLNFPRAVTTTKEETTDKVIASTRDEDSDIDLDDIEPVSANTIYNCS